MIPLATPLLASFLDVLEIVLGVLLSLTGLGLLLMGLIGTAAGRWRRGLLGAAAGLGLTALGFWLVGVF